MKNVNGKFLVYEDQKENELFERKTFIGTGLGGDKNRLRYYFVINTIDGRLFTNEQKSSVRKELLKVSQQHDSKIEHVYFKETYVLIKMLVPIDIAIGEVIEQTINMCNTKKKILRFHYFVTNVKKPTVKDIQEYLKNLNKQPS